MVNSDFMGQLAHNAISAIKEYSTNLLDGELEREGLRIARMMEDLTIKAGHIQAKEEPEEN